MAGSARRDPSCSFGIVAAVAAATLPTLQNIDRVNQHGQQEAPFA
jgi:hypothetical protein